MKSNKVIWKILLPILLIFLSGCFPGIRTYDDARAVYVENEVSAKFRPPHLWEWTDAVPIQSVDSSKSKIVLPRLLPENIVAIANKIREKLKLMNSNASVEIIGKAIIIKKYICG